MKKVLVFLLAVAMPVVGFAKGSNMQRGGLGYLFPDANSFNNPAQFATTKGTAIQAEYTRGDTDPADQVATPSFVYGNGKVGFGAKIDRAGTSLTESGSYEDALTGGLGFALGQSFTVGASYSKVITSGTTSPDTLNGFVTLNPGKGKGFGITGGYTQTLNTATPTKGLTGAIGYKFNDNSNIEGGLLMDLDDTTAMSFFGALTVGNGKWYGSARFDYDNSSTDMNLSGRLGLMLGQKVDISGTLTKALPASGTGGMNFGGTFRVAF
jgi:hypothetical protein